MNCSCIGSANVVTAHGQLVHSRRTGKVYLFHRIIDALNLASGYSYQYNVLQVAIPMISRVHRRRMLLQHLIVVTGAKS
jgi:hypothetical protein